MTYAELRPGADLRPGQARLPRVEHDAPPGLRDLPPDLIDTIGGQAGIASARQLARAGLARDRARAHVRAGRWQRVHPHVYATFSGPLPRDAVIWAALLYAGRGATASHETAAELWGLADPQSVVHVTIPVERRVPSIPGVQIHYAHRLPTSRHPLQSPPVTTVEDTVLDLIDRCVRMDEVQMWVTRACQRRRTTPERLGLALDDRKKIRWRVATSKLIAEVSSGAETPLEVAYARRVERAHGLPVGRRQRHRHVGLRSQWSDVEYEDYRTVVELDGRVGHVEDGRFRDHRRDNAASLRGDVTLRYGWSDTTNNSCHVAAEVAAVLRRNGWSGSPRPCGPGCVIHQAAA